VTPAGLTLQWQASMENPFGAIFDVFNLDFFDARPGTWNRYPRVITSVDALKRNTGGPGSVTCSRTPTLGTSSSSTRPTGSRPRRRTGGPSGPGIKGYGTADALEGAMSRASGFVMVTRVAVYSGKASQGTVRPW
jgi:hypothetical protein